MKLTMKRVRDIFNGLAMLGQEPIETHLLNFRLKVAVSLLQPFMESLQKQEEAVLLENCEKGPDGRAASGENGAPKWLTPDREFAAVAVLNTVLDAEVEVPGLVALSWELVEKSKCFYVNKETGARTREPVPVSLPVQLLLGDFLLGEPAALAVA